MVRLSPAIWVLERAHQLSAAVDDDVPGQLLPQLGRLFSRSAHAFRELTEPHRKELQVHCYRMLGSFFVIALSGDRGSALTRFENGTLGWFGLPRSLLASSDERYDLAGRHRASGAGTTR